MPRLPTEIESIPTADGMRYRLPRPDLGAFRLIGLVIGGIGLAPIGMAAAFSYFVLDNRPEFRGFEAVILALVLIVPLLMAAFGALIVFVGLWLLFGHCEVEITPRRVRGIWRVGPFWLSRRGRRSGLRKFTVAGPEPPTGHDGSHIHMGSTLQAEYASRKPLVLANGYSRELLLALAEELVQQTLSIRSEEWDASLSPPVGVGEESGDPAEVRPRAERPGGSTAELQQHVDGVTITLPAAGLLRGAGCFLFVWSFGWNLIAIPMSIGLWCAALTGNLKDETGRGMGMLFGLLFPIPFLAVGIGSLLYVLHAGRRYTTLVARSGRLAIRQTGLFGEREQSWSVQELCEVRANTLKQSDGEGGVRWKTVLEVVPTTRDGMHFLSYRDKVEVEWIATLLTRELKLPPHPPYEAN